MKIFFFIVVILQTVISCKSIDQKEGIILRRKPTITIEVLGKEQTHEKQLNEIFKNVEIIPLRVPDSSFFVASIDKLIVFRNRYYILDKRFSNLLCFDMSGKMLAKFGEIGLNESQYKKISDFDIDSVNNQLLIFCNESRAFYYYSLTNSSFIKKNVTGLYGSGFSIQPDGKLFLYKNYTNFDNGRNHNAILIDSSNNVLKRYFGFNPEKSTMSWPFTGFVQKSGGNTFLAEAFGDTIYQYDNERFVPYLNIVINTDWINQNRFDHKKLFTSPRTIDSSTSFLRSAFFKNSHYFVLNYQSERRVKTLIGHLDNNSFQILTNKYVDDVLTQLIEQVLFLTQDDKVIFRLSRENAMLMKRNHHELFEKLSPDQKLIVDHINELSGDYLLTATIRK